MKVYRGERTGNGAEAWVDGEPLSPREDIKRISKYGFEWSYEGNEPAQLALAILADHLGNADKALAACPAFMRAIVANFDNDWEITSADVDEALSNLGLG